MFSQLKNAVARGFGRIGDSFNKLLFTDIKVPAVALPTGPQPDDYVVFIDLTETTKLLRRGYLARPVLRIWAARNDMDRYLLAERVTDAFTAAFQKAKGRKICDFEKLETEARTISERLRDNVSLGCTTLIGILLASNPLVDLLFLLLALGTGRDAINDMMSLIANKARTFRSDRAVQENRAKAVASIEGFGIFVGTRLQDLVMEMCAVDLLPAPDEQQTEAEEFMLPRRAYQDWLNAMEDDAHRTIAEALEIPHA